MDAITITATVAIVTSSTSELINAKPFPNSIKPCICCSYLVTWYLIKYAVVVDDDAVDADINAIKPSNTKPTIASLNDLSVNAITNAYDVKYDVRNYRLINSINPLAIVIVNEET